MIQGLVDHPEAVRVTRKDDEMGVLLLVDMANGDMGSLVGRGGATAISIRRIARIYGYKHRMAIHVKFNEPEGSTFKPRL